ncbi:MAG: hypothetical protein K0S44_1755 [Bacteroidetes bacterium]|nr:hypothetical protein [Bacteroidota bacterium]
MRKLLFILMTFSIHIGFSQSGHEKSAIALKESELSTICKKLYSSTGENQALQNGLLIEKFDSILHEPNSFENYEFDSLKKDLSILRSPDNKFRIIHWHLEKSDGTFEYFGFIQSKHSETKKGLFKKSKTETIQLYPLTDRSSEIKNPENTITDNKKWYGMRYYKIIHTKTRTKNYYTLLGWDGNDKFSQKKIIDVLTFDNTGIPRFGADIFNYGKKYPKRVIFEYSATCSMSLKYSSKKDSIVFAHLAPIKPTLEGQYQYYCSDMSFDGFGFKKGKWNYGKDLNAVNDKNENDKLYNNPTDTRSGPEAKSNNYKEEMKKRSKPKKKKTE